MLFLYFSAIRMANILYITIFLVCILICSGVSLILHKYQGTVSPVNQNIITKLSSFCVLLITPVVYIEVHTTTTTYIFSSSNEIDILSGNICDLEDSIWPTGLPDGSRVTPPSLFCGDGVLWNRKYDKCAATAYCATGALICSSSYKKLCDCFAEL